MTQENRLYDMIDRIGEDHGSLQKQVNELAIFSLVHHSGRVHCFNDNRWVTNSDDELGIFNPQWSENSGTGADPNTEYEHLGHLIPAGYRVKRLTIAGRANNNQVDDIEVRAYIKRPLVPITWQTGITNDSEDEEIQILNFNMQTGITGDTESLHLQNQPVPVALQEITEPSMLLLYFRPVGNLSNTRYYYVTLTWELEKIQ